jgi:hypothetical protein
MEFFVVKKKNKAQRANFTTKKEAKGLFPEFRLNECLDK